MSKLLNIAVIGCGTIANAQHLPALKKNPDVILKYCVDIILQRAEAAKEKFGAEISCADYSEALSDKEVKAVWICTPNKTHYTIAMAALNAGKHVFCEKPITVNYALSKEMADLAAQKKLMLNIGVCNRFHKSVELIKRCVEEGQLGELYHTYCSFRAHRAIPGLGGYFTDKSQAGGGVLIDWGVHFLDIILYVAGMPKAKAVSAVSYNKLGKDIKNYVYKDMWAGPPVQDGVYDVEEFVSGLIRTDEMNISFNGAWAQNIGEEEMFIDFIGTKGGVRLQYGQGFTLYDDKGGTLNTTKPVFNIPSMFEAENASFISAVKTGVKDRSNIADVLETAKIMDAVYASAEKGGEVIL